MLQETTDREEIIERVAALDIGKAGLVCCIRVPHDFVLLTRWLTGRGGRHARGAEQAFPVLAVLAHGTVAILTFVLVLPAAIAVSRRGRPGGAGAAPGRSAPPRRPP